MTCQKEELALRSICYLLISLCISSLFQYYFFTCLLWMLFQGQGRRYLPKLWRGWWMFPLSLPMLLHLLRHVVNLSFYLEEEDVFLISYELTVALCCACGPQYPNHSISPIDFHDIIVANLCEQGLLSFSLYKLEAHNHLTVWLYFTKFCVELP